ncbi:MAG: sirohydrochlorin cobaltochelatase [Humidesulfovibrio sp.]|nr:sirohydrochlorin cobaltochelatase [Desulfovibrio sp.]MDO9081762.1 sirohydrochlorin cobaltochelatase [Humidesulfovibrio sp.]
MRFPTASFLFRLVLCASLALAAPCAALAGQKAKAPDQRGILVVVFGTTVAEGAKTYAGLKAATEQAFPDLPVRLAYTSAHARKTARKTADEAGTPVIDLPSPAQALARMADEGFTHVAVQSMHVMPGREFHDLVAAAKALEGLPKGLRKVTLGLPLLSGEDDLRKAALALVSGARATGKNSEALVFVGHGTGHAASMAYPALQYFLWRQDRLALVGVIDGAPSLDDVLAELKARRPVSVRLIPLLSVAGDHAQNDIGGSEQDSWLSRIRASGLPCTADLRGLMERPEINALWLGHLRDAVKELGD